MAETERGRSLPATSYAILGLLTFGEMSGYDLTKFVDRSVGHFMTPAKSQIYSELRRLVALGWTTEREVPQRDRPNKRMYEITAEGRAALRSWLEDADVEPESFKSPFMVRVFFGAHMSPGALARQIEEYRRQCQEELAELRHTEKHLKLMGEALFYPYLTLKAGLTHTRAAIRWADEALSALEERRIT
jgi:PadR family transcriptional regulator AphA